ncbi:Protein of unknown function DUF594 - like 4 [Theobroma cacao]|nr:Protein of unknown function DUF594 - like 4 [Theobroma cacao]
MKQSVMMKFFSQIAIQLWSEWELRLMVIVSLALQICLVYCGKKRQKYQGNHLAAVAISAWITYQSATSVANLVLTSLLKGGTKLKNWFIVFWSPFILWHLGSPHNITAYSLEDNDMWLRQFFGLVTQVGMAIYIQISFRSSSTFNCLAIPIFIAGVFKAGERIWALRCASEKQLINSSCSLNDEDRARQQMVQPARKNKEVRILRQAYLSSIIFKPLFTDLPFWIEKKAYDEVVDLKSEYADEEGQSKKDMPAEEAFALVGIELSFLYDLFFTKMPIHHQGFKLGSVPPENKLYSKLVALRLSSINSRSAIRRVAQHDLISYYVEVAADNKFIRFIRLIDTSNLLQKHKYTVWESVDSNLRTFIYEQLLEKRNEYHDQLRNCTENRDSLLSSVLDKDIDDVFKKYAVDDNDWDGHRNDFARYIFLCHIATSLVYYDDLYNHRRGMLGSYCKISKTLSDYMAYLVLLRPTMLPKGLGEIINLANNKFVEKIHPRVGENSSELKKKIVEALIHYRHDYTTSTLFESEVQKNRVLLLKGSEIAQRLQNLVSDERWDHEKKWETIGKLWMRNLTYAASRCSWKDHAQQLRHGGELLTHVALLMAHLGLSTKILIYEREDESGLPSLF